MWRRNMFCLGVLGIGASLAWVAGCGGGEEGDGQERADIETLGAKADIPGWMRHIPVNWACDQTLNGMFQGLDSAHLYSFPGKVGYAYTFEFKATYPAWKGAAVAVYDSETGDRVALTRNPTSNKASVKYRAEKSIKYLVAVYSIAWSATGSYTLGAKCELTACQSNKDCGSGEYCEFGSACGKAGAGSCSTKPQACYSLYQPVCGCDGQTYGNDCDAHAAGTSMAYAGQCKSKPTECEAAGGTCTHFASTCNTGYQGGAPMDCPLGKSGMCCLPAVTLTVDRQGYRVSETIAATLNNGFTGSIFLGGCSVLSWQKEVNGGWVDQGPDKICVWEGYASELKAGTSSTESLFAKNLGTWRLAAGYGIGCTPGKPLSQAGCAATGMAYSEPFVVKDCPLLSMPNPAAFCPQGKIVPRHDAEGICITGYDCLPCEVKDCGPAMGMPNTICSDGKTVAGPTGKCLPTGWGSCAWEVIECSTCKPTGCSGQLCADRNMFTTCEYMPWYACVQQSQCGEFGPSGACAWKETPGYLACMAQYGK